MPRELEYDLIVVKFYPEGNEGDLVRQLYVESGHCFGEP